MSLELIAVDGCTVDHGTGSPISDGVFVITSTPSTKAKAEGKGVYTTPLTVTFSGGSASGFLDESVMTTAPVAIAATATKTKAGGILVMREGDSLKLMTCIGTIDPPPPSPPYTGPIAGPIEISVAGQTKVKAQ
jgi:hypothetical protein